MATNQQVYEEPCDACINAGWFPPFLLGWVSLRGHCTQYPPSAHAVHQYARSIAKSATFGKHKGITVLGD